MNQLGTSLMLNDAAGQIAGPGSMNTVAAVAIKRALVGTLTIGGLANNDGSAYGNWTLGAGSQGAYYPPASGCDGSAGLWYQLSNQAADSGAVVVAITRRP